MAGWVFCVGGWVDGWMDFMWSEGTGIGVLSESGKGAQTLIICHPEVPIQYLASLNLACPSILILPHPQENRTCYSQGCQLLRCYLTAVFTSPVHALVSSLVKWT